MGENPFADPLRFERRAPPCAIVIFGANGDLTKRKLTCDGRIPPTFAVIGNSRTDMPDDDFRAKMREAVEHFSEDSPFDPALWDSFAANLFYVAGDMKDAGLYQRLTDKLADLAQSHRTNRATRKGRCRSFQKTRFGATRSRIPDAKGDLSPGVAKLNAGELATSSLGN